MSAVQKICWPGKKASKIEQPADGKGSVPEHYKTRRRSIYKLRVRYMGEIVWPAFRGCVSDRLISASVRGLPATHPDQRLARLIEERN